MDNLNFTEVPLTQQEDCNADFTEWINGMCVKLNEEKYITYYVMHKKEQRVIDLPDNETAKEKTVCVAVPVRVKRGIMFHDLECQVTVPELLTAVTPLFVRDNYDNVIAEKIRERYSLNQELAILRQADSKPEEYQNYYSFAENVKKWAKEQLTKL